MIHDRSTGNALTALPVFCMKEDSNAIHPTLSR